ncbi:outer membrane protein transport protein [Rugamonas apoptosis]|uniref:Outer membrane protein transport protein n=1 Tax=Rugamonas apoptosis TaxID=2758570 RepID=A0A7W2FCC9_9BURK|nr:outer membrane protein transport protein [Rugamonas apoptosis]MBA5689106.1 outer membrane protein transport protein [Rugamonas apoptosis]
MNDKKTSLALTTLVTTLGYASAAWSNGLALNEQSASGFGTAYAGRSSSALDASTIYGNPAGLSRIARKEVSGGFALIDVKDRISDALGEAPGTNNGDSVPLTAIPFGYVAMPIDERFTFGLGFYVPFGLVNEYESTFQGRYHATYSKVQVMTLQPTIAYRIDPHVSIGGGLTLNRIDNNLQTDLATGALNGGKDTHIKITGNDIAVGANLGVLIDLGAATTWGASYHSKFVFHANGHTEVSNTPAAFNLDGNYSNRIDTAMPESVDTSLTHHFDQRWTGYLGTTWTRWSRIQRVQAVNSGVSPLGQQLGFGTFGDDFKFHDTWSAAVGASYQYSRQWLLRAGYAYDQSPARNAYRNVRVPVGNRKALTLGAGYAPNPDLTVDIAYGYLWEPTTVLNQANTSGAQPGYSAQYHNSANVLAVQISSRF